MGPTGAVNASATDMAQYLLMLTSGGSFEGKAVVSASDLLAMTNPQMVLPDARRWLELAPLQYGMGFFVGQYRGVRYFEHGGNMPGAAAAMIVFPEHKLGIFVCANVSGTSLRDALQWILADAISGLEPLDWGTRLKTEEDAGRASEQEARAKNVDPRKPDTRPSHTLNEYVGEYEHPGYGRLSVTASDSAALPLVFNYNGNRSKMQHFHYDLFKVPEDKLNAWEKTKLNFITEWDGEIEAVDVPFEPAVAPIHMKRLPEARLSDPKFIARFVGAYAIGGIHIEVAQRSDGLLTVTFPGQPALLLEPVRGTRFAVKTRAGTSVQFTVGNAGPATEMAILNSSGDNRVAKALERR